MTNRFIYFLPLLCITATTLAMPSINVEKEYYSISGSTADELRQQMDTLSPVQASGERYDAYTSWFVNWRFNWDTVDNQCQITQVNSTVDVKFTLPEWENRQQSDTALKFQWDKYYQALILHEKGHQLFGVKTAKIIERKLMMLSADTCQELETNANALANQILDRFVTWEKRYDDITNHGMRTGARFP